MDKTSGVLKKFSGSLSLVNRPAVFWSILIVLFCLARIATWGYPYDSDHWIFYYIGKDWANGGELYITAWDHKPPLIFAFNALMYLIAGDNIILHRVWLTVVSATTIVLFYMLAKEVMPRLLGVMFGRTKVIAAGYAAKLAVLIFTFLTSLSQFASSGNNTENYGLLFLVAMWLGYYKYVKSKKPKFLLVTGLCLAALFFLKGTFVLFGLPLAVLLIMQHRLSLKKILAALVLAGTPLVIIAGMVSWYFTSHGTFNEFLVASFGFSAKYATSAWSGGVSNEPLLNIITFGTLLPAIVTFFVMIRRIKSGRLNSAYVAVAASFAVGLVVVLSVGSFYPYYLQIIMPFVAILFAYALIAALHTKKLLRNGILTGFVVLALVFYGISLKQLLNNYTGSARLSADESMQVAAYIKQRTLASDRIFDDEYGATMYELAARESGSRFVSASVLLLDYRDSYGFKLDDLFINDMESSRAVYVVVPVNNVLYGKNVPVTDYINSHYHVEKTFTTLQVLRRN